MSIESESPREDQTGDRTFEPDGRRVDHRYERWSEAVERSLDWAGDEA